MTIYLNKKKVFTKLQDEKHVLYNYVVNILLDRILSKKFISTKDKVVLVASKRETNKFLYENFVSYLKNQADKNHKVSVEVQIKSPAEEKCLQVVDFVSWAIFKKYEENESEYYLLIKQRIVEEKALFG